MIVQKRKNNPSTTNTCWKTQRQKSGSQTLSQHSNATAGLNTSNIRTREVMFSAFSTGGRMSVFSVGRVRGSIFSSFLFRDRFPVFRRRRNFKLICVRETRFVVPITCFPRRRERLIHVRATRRTAVPDTEFRHCQFHVHVSL